VAPLAGAILGGLPRLRADVDRLATAGLESAQLGMRRLERRMAVTYIAALLTHQAADHEAETGSGRLGYIAARFAARLGGPAAEAAVGDDAGWLADFDGIVRGGQVSPTTASEAAMRTAGALQTAVSA
jgi:hypothetical protein